MSLSLIRNPQSRLMFLAAALASVALPQGRAQFAGPGQSFSADLSYSGKAEVRRLNASAETSAVTSKLDYSYTAAAAEGTLWSLGLDWKDIRFSLEDLNPLATELQELEVTLGASHRIGRQWTLLGRVGLGWASAGTRLESDAFRPTAMLGASYAASKDLQWLLGVSYNPFSRYQVLPLAGFNWRFAPGWSASLGLPQTGVSHVLSDSLKLSVLVGMEGGSFHVTRTAEYAQAQYIPAGGRPYLPANGMKDTELDYRELRAGLGVEWTPAKGLSLVAEAGAVLNRKWSFHEYDLNYAGKGSAYARLAVRHRF
jgi:hypothetical protein